jgi:hypothetical protein
MSKGRAGQRSRIVTPITKSPSDWIDKEVAGCHFADARLADRFRLLLARLAESPGESIPLACQDWAQTKAAYRFFDNERVNEADILAGHWQATRERFRATDGPVLVLHDTSEFSYQRSNIDAIGKTRTGVSFAPRAHRPQKYTVCGMLMHSSLVVTPEGLPLGLAAIKFWTRPKFKGANELKRHINPTRVPIEKKESIRWLQNLQQSTKLLGEAKRCVHIGDRESDIYELFCAARTARTHFLIRTCVDRLAAEGTRTIATEMAEVVAGGTHCITVQDRKGKPDTALLELKYRQLKVLPPIGKQKKYPGLILTVLHAVERGRPKNRDRIEWKLITDLPVTSPEEAVEKLNWYALRWKIETFHKIMKSGCRAEQSKLRTAERIVNLLATFCIVSWRIFWLTIMARVAPEASPSLAFTPLETTLLEKLAEREGRILSKRSLSYYLISVARLGGYLARASDPPPGNAVMWRGMSRLIDIQLGYLLASQDVGN